MRRWQVSETEAVERASQLPLIDAAYYLWRLRHRIPKQDHPPPPTPVDYESQESVRQAVQAAHDRVQRVFANAESGETFERLKAAHFRSNDEDLRCAIRAALALERGAFENCKRQVPSVMTENIEFIKEIEHDMRDCLEKTRIQFPGFQSSTYDDMEKEVRSQLR